MFQRQNVTGTLGFQPFHTDTGSILGLYALDKAAYGGESKIVSSWKIYNQLRRIRPDLVRVLADCDWVFDTYVILFSKEIKTNSIEALVKIYLTRLDH